MPFCPLTLSSSPSGPCTMLTPGVSFVKSRKLRPLLGRPWIEAELMRVDDSARVVSITGESACTTISSWTLETLSDSARFADWPTVSTMPSRTSVAKPVSETVTL